MSTRETILAAIATALSGVASGRVYRSRREQLGTLPAVIVRPLGEDAEEPVIGSTDRRLEVGVEVYAAGDVPDTAVDATLKAAHDALMADLTLGLGSEVQIDTRHRIDWDDDAYDEGRAVLRLTVSYRTQTGVM